MLTNPKLVYEQAESRAYSTTCDPRPQVFLAHLSAFNHQTRKFGNGRSAIKLTQNLNVSLSHTILPYVLYLVTSTANLLNSTNTVPISESKLLTARSAIPTLLSGGGDGGAVPSRHRDRGEADAGVRRQAGDVGGRSSLAHRRPDARRPRLSGGVCQHARICVL